MKEWEFLFAIKSDELRAFIALKPLEDWIMKFFDRKSLERID